ncbi:thiol reductant ABC exporter subunit CydC [Vreelandella malpeensis]|uniref:Thiol reductant ABC exporter subunit CydC n=1 Tax=Vreelandella malpeensis TaxID=1172368 RepID=A0ABS8DVU1_9GAMM|nr:thiol reductant ABC exporter subunit CydC [Halomonas malpeensis]MCB8890401.1 thiol reductant ABC exporter subunit CydC [Halomonas malpeensis]
MKAFFSTLYPWLSLLVRRRAAFMVGSLLVLATLLSGLSLLGLSGWFITACALAGLLLAAGQPSTLDIYVPGGGIRFFALARTVARYVERLYNHNMVLTLLADLRYQVFGYLTRLDAASLGRRRASDWLTRLTADIDTLDNLYLRLLIPPLVALVATLLIALFIAIWLPGLALLVAGVLVALWAVLTLGFTAWGFRQSGQQVRDQGTLRNLVLDQLQASAELSSYGTARWHQAKIDALETRSSSNQRRLAFKGAMGNALILLVCGLLLIMALRVGGEALATGRIDAPIVVMILLVVLGSSEILAPLPGAFLKFGASFQSVLRLDRLASSVPVETATNTPLPAGQGGYDVLLENAGYRYPGMLERTLEQVSLKIGAGDRVAVTGISGAGKSTLANLLLGRLIPTQGRVEVAGRMPCDVAFDQRASHFAFLSQQVDLFDGTLADNLRLADPSADDAKLWRALDQVALADWAERQPRGLSTPVGEKGRRLSGGQARRVALARLFLRGPRLVLLDEPFAGVDAETARHLAKSLDRWLQGRTAVYFIHQVDDVSLLPGLTYSYSLDRGRLTAIGSDHAR